MFGVFQKQVLVVARRFAPTGEDFLQGHLTRADIFGSQAGLVARAANSIPRIGAVRAVVRYAIPLGKVT